MPYDDMSMRAVTREERDSGDADQTGIRVSGVAKSYGSIQAVRGIDLTIAAGETAALLGPNGAGKTTTLDMILGLVRPDRGTVSVFDLSPAVAVRQGRVGGMLQTGLPLDYLSVRELVALMASYYPHPLAIDEVLRLTGSAAFASQATSKLSGGQAQRVRFAAALVGDPDLLVLDEPTAGIDVEGRHEFWGAMRAVAERGKTILFATHYLEEADQFADRIVLMAGGLIVADGSATEIKARVGSRTVRATLPDVAVASLLTLSGVLSAERRGDAVILSCSDADAALYNLLTTFGGVRDVEVRGGSLEEAFLELTADEQSDGARVATAAGEVAR